MSKDAVQKERDSFTIVLEDIRSDFRMFGEVLTGVSDRLDRVGNKVDANFEEIGKVKIRLEEVNDGLDNIEKEIKSLRGDFDDMKSKLEEKAGLDWVKKFEKRLTKVEKHLKLATS